MKRIAYCFASLLIAMAIGTVSAQEGHPLVGSWHGDWGPNAKDRTDVTFVVKYDGSNLTVLLNPGFDTVTMDKAVLEPKGWMVHFEGAAKDKSGKPTRVIVDGKIEDVTSVHRSISGSWMQGAVKGDFKVTRDN